MQARLTLWSIIVMALIVGFVSTLDLADEIDRQFQSNRQRAEAVLQIALDLVIDSLQPNFHSTVTSDISNKGLISEELQPLITVSHSLVEIAVCDPHGRILADTKPEHVGAMFPAIDSFSSLVNRTNWWDKLRVLLWDKSTYRISQDLAVAGKSTPLLTVHTVVHPASIRDDIMPSIQAHVGISIASIAGAMLAALLFSTVVFRPLGKLDQMLDTITRGEYEYPAAQEKPPSSTDAVGAVASKVSVLGQRLRGAKSEVSDLKDHIARLLDELEDAVLIFGRDRRLIAAAGSIEHFLPRPRAELLGRPLTEIFSPSTLLGLLLAQALQTGRPLRNRRVPLTHEDGKGRMPVALLSVEMMDAGPNPGSGAGLVVRLRDPEATRKIGRQLQLADRLSAISQLTSGVAHEVKNPLNAMFMHVELARMKMAHGDCDLEPQMDVISSEIMRLDRVVKTFLDFTRPVKLNMTEVSLDAFVNDLVELARPQTVAAGIEIVVKQSPESVSINVDADLLKQAGLNIVVNAIEAMPDGGVLSFESGVKGENAEIRISDTGPGIPPEVRDKIYNLYFTTKEQGSGIGLAMTFRIVQLHDGTLDFSSEPGKGTSFVMRFPVAVQTA
ncbi:MAG: ATP-binding protein [Acidobacteriota bacterium]|nr:ATP-binding protein [Acidobacteriota bacterium]